jgi:hypothetical protein
MFHRLTYFSFSISSACNCAELTELNVKLFTPCLALSVLISSSAYFTNSSRVGSVGVGLGVGVGVLIGVGVGDGTFAVDVGGAGVVGGVVGIVRADVVVSVVGVGSGLAVGVVVLSELNILLLKTITVPAIRSAAIRMIAKIFVREFFDDDDVLE